MSVTIDPVACTKANSFLRAMPSMMQARGEEYFREGRVKEITSPRENCFVAKVEGTQTYTVDMQFLYGTGWQCDCTCPVVFECKHIYAAMKTLLAENSAAQVQQLSAGQTSKPEPRKSFAEQVEGILGRPLAADEKKFLKKHYDLYCNCSTRRQITNADFRTLGFHLPGYEWQMLDIWPSFPKSEYDFWLYLANALLEHGISPPAFMQPLSDVARIKKALGRWRRSREIERWKKNLDNVEQHSVHSHASRVRFELRLRFEEYSIGLEGRREGQKEFEIMNGARGRRLRDELRRGTIEMTAEEGLLWEFFAARVDYPGALHFRSNDPATYDKMNRLLRLPNFHSVLVNPEGKPFARPDEQLSWQLQVPTEDGEDYHLRLARPDGSPITRTLCILEGKPTYYVTPEAIYRGPSIERAVVNATRDNIIPSAALETRAGARLLQSLGLELPARLRERVKMVPLRVEIVCYLRKGPGRKAAENCFFQFRAIDPENNLVKDWNGSEWANRYKESEARDRREGIVLYDESALHDPRTLMLALEVKMDAFTMPFIRVTKRFPEEFSAWLKTLPANVKLDLQEELASLGIEPVSGRVRLDVTEAEIDWFDLSVVLDVQDTTLTQDEMKLLLNARGSYVRLPGKGWRRFQFDLSAEEDERLARLGLHPHEMTGEPQRLHALQLADEAAKKFLPEPQYESIQRRASEIKTRVTPAVPETVRAELRPYQLEGFHFLAYLTENRFGGILADDMGLGKTLQTLTWLQWLRAKAAAGDSVAGPLSGSSAWPNGLPSLVICPKSVMDNWRAEAERFTPGLRVKVWSASELSNFFDQLVEADVHVLNYNQLRLVGESISRTRWLAAILDEGQYVKNPDSQTAQVARTLKANHRLILSGTPIENRLLDLWSLMAYSMPGILGNRAQFLKIYDSIGDANARKRLASRVRPFLLRRTKTQVAKDLPDRIEEDLFCEIEGEQKMLYRAELKHAQQMLLKVTTQKQLAQERFHFLTSLLRLRQICCHPRLVKPDSKAEAAKVEALLEQLEPIMEEGNKVLVFSQFVEMLKILEDAIKPRAWRTFYLAGETENRGELVQKFQSTQGAAVFLISLKAGGFGLNLTAASYVVLFDPWWNPAVENQAIDRTHRIGQSRNVIAYRLLIKNSIEEKIRSLQKKKSELADDVLGEEKFAQSLTLDDMQFLLSDSGV